MTGFGAIGAGQATPPASRIALIDLARGVALVAMVIFHFAWDLSFLRFIATDIATHPGWRLFSHAIAGSFLALAGLGLGLAHGQGFRGPAFWRRVAVIGAAALAVTIATAIAMPDAYVLFGILHCIALGAVVCAPLLAASWCLPLGLAGLVAAAPTVLSQPTLANLQTALEASAWRPLWQHLGLTASVPAAVDFVPLVPWLAFMLAGLSAGLWLARSGKATALVSIRLPEITRPLALAGRYSLPIYLVHQPILIGMLMAVAWLAPGLTAPQVANAEAVFRRDCIMQCRATRNQQVCVTACGCVLDELRRDPDLFAEAIGTRRSRDQATGERTDAAIGEAARLCFRRTQTP